MYKQYHLAELHKREGLLNLADYGRCQFHSMLPHRRTYRSHHGAHVASITSATVSFRAIARIRASLLATNAGIS